MLFVRREKPMKSLFGAIEMTESMSGVLSYTIMQPCVYKAKNLANA